MRLALALSIGTLALLTIASTPAVADDLRCYKVKDPQAKMKYVADVEGITAEPGCTIKVPATTICVPAKTTNVNPNPPGSPNVQRSKGFACYETKCPKQKPKKVLSKVRANDRFGDRSVTPTSASKLLCVPLDTGVFCGDSLYPQCGGLCPDGQVCQTFLTLNGAPLPGCSGQPSCACVDPAKACLNAPCPSRYCQLGSCGAVGSKCFDCKRSGAVCASDDDCCFSSCAKINRDDPTGTCVED